MTPEAVEVDLSEEENKFRQALGFLLNAELAKAECAFRLFCLRAQDSTIVRHAKEALANILFLRNKWSEFLNFVEDNPEILTFSKLDQSNHLFAQALRDAPQETYHFSSQPVAVRTELLRTGIPEIEVHVNGRRWMFMLDTGANVSVVSDEVARVCKIKPLSEQSGLGATSTSKKIAFKPALIDELEIGDLTILNHPVGIVRKDDLEFKLFGLFDIVKIDGIIGWPLFMNTVVEIDYKNLVTTISKPQRMNVPERNLYWLGYPFVVLNSQDGHRLNFAFDTGAASTSIMSNIFTKIRPGKIITDSGIRIGAGGSERVVTRELEDVTFFLDDTALHFDSISTTSGARSAFLVKPDGKLGSDIAPNGKMSIDYLNGRFEVTSGAQ